MATFKSCRLRGGTLSFAFLFMPLANTLVKPLVVAWAMALAVTLTGCQVKSGLDNKTSEEAPPLATENGIAVRAINATNNSAWVYFDLVSNSVVYPSNPDASSEWDIAFQRFKIKINSGVSGTGNVKVAVLKDSAFSGIATLPTNISYHSDRALAELSDAELIALDAGQFFAVCATGFTCINTQSGSVDRTHLNPTIAAYALLTFGSGVMYSSGTQKPILGWYDYYMDEGHVLKPAGDTWLIKTVEGIDVKLELLGYYGASNNSEAGNIALRYQSLTPGFTVPAAGAAQLIVAATASSTRGPAPLQTQFAATVTGGTATEWLWNFGDDNSNNNSNNNTANTANATHTYTQPGSYIATVTVTDSRGARGTQALSIIVDAPGNQIPVANAGPDQNIQLLLGETQKTVVLDGILSDDSDGTIVSYNWSGSPQPNPGKTTSVVLPIGRYTYTLTVTDNRGATATDSVEIVVASPGNSPPRAVISALPLSGAAPLNVVFDSVGSGDDDGTLVSYQWDFGDGGSASDATTSHTYTQPGRYDAKLTVTDDAGASASLTVQIDATLVFAASADTFVYEFLGNQTPSNSILVWNHESNHKASGLMDFDGLDARLSTLSAGHFTAKLRLYIVCEPGGYVVGCPGDADVDSPGGLATVTTAIRTQLGAWQENDTGLLWAGVQEGTQYATFTVNSTGHWVDIDITNLVEAWRNPNVGNGSTGNGIVLTQTASPVVRSNVGNIAVLAFRSRESPVTAERPYIEIYLH